MAQKKDEKRIRKRSDDIECLDLAIPEARTLWVVFFFFFFLVIITNKIHLYFYS